MPEFKTPLHQQISDAVNGSIRRKLRDAAAGTALPTDVALILVDLLALLGSTRRVLWSQIRMSCPLGHPYSRIHRLAVGRDAGQDSTGSRS